MVSPPPSGPAAGEPPPYRVRVAELPEGKRPRKRLLCLGPYALISSELPAILLRTGTAREGVIKLATRLIHAHGGLRGLAAADLVLLGGEHGVGNAKATTIAAAFELGRRLAIEGDVPRPTVTSPAYIARLLQSEMELLAQE